MIQIDIADNYDGAFMFDRIEKKYKGVEKSNQIKPLFLQKNPGG